MLGIGGCTWDRSQVGQLLVGHSLSLCFHLHACRINLHLKYFGVGWCLCLAIRSDHFRFHICSSEPQLKSPPLIFGCFPYPRCPSCPGDAHHLFTPISVNFHSFAWPSSHLSISFPYLILYASFASPYPFSSFPPSICLL